MNLNNLYRTMQPRNMKSIGALQESMKQELSRMSRYHNKSVDLHFNKNRKKSILIGPQLDRISLKSCSTRKRDTSITLSSQTPILFRQTSLEYLKLEDPKKVKTSKKGKLKKKQSGNINITSFSKLKRQETLPQFFSGLIQSQTTIDLIQPVKGQRSCIKTKSVQQYQSIIVKQQKLIETLQKIIEGLQS